MADYYFDVETNPSIPDPRPNDEILTIQFQQIEIRTGEIKGELNILKSWESSERDILQKSYSIFSPEDNWKFVPVGCNLSFDFFSLLYRWREIDINISPQTLFRNHPYLDVKSILVIFNKGSFGGAKLGKFIGKQHGGIKVSEWYKQEDYASIQKYIEDEAEGFISLYKYLINRLPSIWFEYAKEKGIIR
ncbi:hypothetical protein ACFLXO_00195 [Chloroflexota bacterium]